MVKKKAGTMSQSELQERAEPPVGLTRDSGWQVGVRRTLMVESNRLWQQLVSLDGLKLWLGDSQGQSLSDEAAFELADGTEVEVKVFKPGSHLRLRWSPPGWQQPSTIQVRVIDKGDRSVLAFHQEQLRSRSDRSARKAYFTGAIARLEHSLESRGCSR